jgi:hypothetical protein
MDATHARDPRPRRGYPDRRRRPGFGEGFIRIYPEKINSFGIS